MIMNREIPPTSETGLEGSKISISRSKEAERSQLCWLSVTAATLANKTFPIRTTDNTACHDNIVQQADTDPIPKNRLAAVLKHFVYIVGVSISEGTNSGGSSITK